MEKNPERLNDLEKGIKQMLIENRCSFSENEIDLLNECLYIVQTQKESIIINEKPDFVLIVKVIETIMKVFMLANRFNEIL